jgi:hypothetical protein
MSFYSGPMTLHTGPDFDFGAFMGLFPVTLVGLIAAFVTALFAGRDEGHQNA